MLLFTLCFHCTNVCAETQVTIRDNHYAFLLDSLTFDSDTIVLTQKSKNTLKRISEGLIKFPEVQFEIIGYADEHECDNRTNNLNIQCIEKCNHISMKRASFIKDILIKKGASNEQLIVSGKGCTVKTSEGLKDFPKINPYNQRVEILRFVKEQEADTNDSIKNIDSTKVNNSDKTLTSNKYVHKDSTKNKSPTSESKPYLKTLKFRIVILLFILIVGIERLLNLRKKKKK